MFIDGRSIQAPALRQVPCPPIEAQEPRHCNKHRAPDGVEGSFEVKETNAKETHQTKTHGHSPLTIYRVVQGRFIDRLGYLCVQAKDRNTHDWPRVVVLVRP